MDLVLRILFWVRRRLHRRPRLPSTLHEWNLAPFDFRIDWWVRSDTNLPIHPVRRRWSCSLRQGERDASSKSGGDEVSSL